MQLPAINSKERGHVMKEVLKKAQVFGNYFLAKVMDEVLSL